MIRSGWLRACEKNRQRVGCIGPPVGRFNQSPVGFWFIAIIDFGILAASLGFALHALGLIGDLPTSMTIQLPRT